MCQVWWPCWDMTSLPVQSNLFASFETIPHIKILTSFVVGETHNAVVTITGQNLWKKQKKLNKISRNSNLAEIITVHHDTWTHYDPKNQRKVESHFFNVVKLGIIGIIGMLFELEWLRGMNQNCCVGSWACPLLLCQIPLKVHNTTHTVHLQYSAYTALVVGP